MKIYFSSTIAMSLFFLLMISCESNKKKPQLSIPNEPIEKIVIGIEDENIILDKSTINEVIGILNNSYALESKEDQSSENKKIRVQLITSNPKKGQLYLLDKTNGYIEILSMQKTTKYKIDEMEKLNNLLNLK